MRSATCKLIFNLAFVLALLAPASARAQDKIPVQSLDDLPRHTYQIPGSASDLLSSQEQMDALMSQVKADVLADLEKYAIEDATTLKGLYAVLLNIAMIGGDYDDALNHVALIRDLEEKEAALLMAGLVTESIIEARRIASDDELRYREAFQQALLERVGGLPWDVVGDEVEARLAQVQIFGENLIKGIVQSRLDPIIETTGGQISMDIAQGLIGMHYALQLQVPLKTEMILVYQSVVDQHRVDKNDIWSERNVELAKDGDYTPVTVCIWDSGVDVGLFPHNLWFNEAERFDGVDTDANGFVDDINGIAYDLHANPVQGLLHPVDQMHGELETVTRHMKGFSDLQAAVNSPEAADVRKMISELDPGDVNSFIEDFGLFGNYSHGTHVAGIAAAGNPHIRLLPVRLTFGYTMIPETPTIASAYRDAGAGYEMIQYMRDAGVRVVNMSWGGNRQGIEDALEANGVGETAEERATLARQIFKIGRDALYNAMADASEILFVTSAGNADNDVEFDEMIPSAFDLPNLLVVGAVDQAGDATSFTSFGRTVDIYANGFEVDSYIPGGERMKMSGTSMSSPNAVNLAAKILAADPDLTPEQVIRLMVKGGDSSPSDKKILLINPKRTFELVERM